jgi:hypothetical protein
MRKRLTILGLVMACCLPVLAAQITLPALKVGSRTYRGVTVLGFNTTDVYFTHAGGISNAKLKYLEPEMQKLFAYDEVAAAKTERQQQEDNEQFQQQVGARAELDFRQARVDERRREMTTDVNLSDPLSDKSPLGLAMPELKIARWIGGKPETRDRYQLIFLWAPWSLASRKYFPEVNALYGKFSKEVAFASLVSEEASDPETDAGVHCDFPTGIDPTGKFLDRLGVTSLPQVVLADKNGIVRYLGHPAALTDKRMQEIMARFWN